MKAIIKKFQLSKVESITFTLKSNALNIFFEPKNNLWIFDLECRLVGMFVNGENYRRTLNNKFYHKSRYTENGETFREIHEIPREKAISLLKLCQLMIDNDFDLPKSFQHFISKISKMDYLALQQSAMEFDNIYLPISILPPDQYMSLVIQMTEGCNYNQCTFCNFYRDRPFKIKSADELEIHLNKIKTFFGEGINLRKSIFLADANALTVPQNRLVKSLELIHEQFPQFENYYSFIDVFTGLKKSVSDFKQLNELGIKRVYLGVESGNNDLMLFLNKQQLNKDIIELTHNIKASGINVGIILLIGAGGEHFAEKHLIDSIRLLKQLPLSKGDIIYLSELYETNSNYEKSMAEQDITLPTRQEIRQWSNEFKSELKKRYFNEVQLSVYDINQFFY
ncbi:radical SAM protein [bacterium]|nr:radical SAM protein [bacterium]